MSGIECVRWTSSISNGPAWTGCAGREHLELRLAQPVLVELGAAHGDRQLAAVDDGDARLPQLAQHPRQRADVVLVAVGDDDRLDVVDVLAQVGEVGQHEVDAHHLGGREAQPDVDDDDPAVVLDDGHVLADLAEPAEREDAQGAAHAVAARSSSPWRSSIALRPRRSLALVGLDHRQAAAPDVVAEQVQRRLGAGRAGGQEQRRVDVAQARVDLRARLGLVEQAPHLVARRCARRRRCRRRRPWSRLAARMSSLPASTASPSIGCSSSELACLTASMPSICASSASRSGPMLTRSGPGCCRGSPACRRRRGRPPRSGGAMPAAVRLVVVGRDRQHGLGARARSTRSVRSTAWRVSLEPAPATIVPSPPSSPTISATSRMSSSSRQRRRLAGGARRPRARRSRCCEQVAAERDGRLLVDGAVRAERRDHRGQQAFVGAHEAQSGGRVSPLAGRRSQLGGSCSGGCGRRARGAGRRAAWSAAARPASGVGHAGRRLGRSARRHVGVGRRRTPRDVGAAAARRRRASPARAGSGGRACRTRPARAVVLLPPCLLLIWPCTSSSLACACSAIFLALSMNPMFLASSRSQPDRRRSFKASVKRRGTCGSSPSSHSVTTSSSPRGRSHRQTNVIAPSRT